MLTINTDEFYDAFPDISDEDHRKMEARLQEEIEEVEKELGEEEVRQSKFLKKYLKGNLPNFPNRPLCSTTKYRVYSFLIRRKKSDESITFQTTAIDPTDAITNIERMFGRDVTDLFYLSPLSVSKPMLPINLPKHPLNNKEEL